jgi:hypothetical protein
MRKAGRWWRPALGCGGAIAGTWVCREPKREIRRIAFEARERSKSIQDHKRAPQLTTTIPARIV